jgi:hypothetical protein
MRTNLLLSCVFLVVLNASIVDVQKLMADKPSSLDEIYNSLTKNDDIVSDSSDFSEESIMHSGVARIKLSQMRELDFKTKKEILELRRARVAPYFEAIRQHYKRPAPKQPRRTLWQRIFGGTAEAAPPPTGDYKPSPAVFGQIVSGKPWWGMLGISYYGPGEKGIAGPSEESRFILNPYLFVGLIEKNARVFKGDDSFAREIYPIPRNLVMDFTTMKGEVTYAISTYMALAQQYGYQDAREPKLTLVAYNARDFRFNYLALDGERTKNIKYRKGAIHPIALKQYIHLGGSCGYQGGCNNMSPKQPALDIAVQQLPATIFTKLWKKRPSKGDQSAPDMEFVIHLR